MTPTLYKCNRAANAIALNPLLLLQKIVPKILKCRNFRGNQSAREGSACHADKNEFTQMPTGFWKSNHSSREIAPRTELKYASKACVVLERPSAQ
jgi:hypothetical protein